MALVTLTSRVEENDKVAFDDFCSSVGLSASAAINMYVKVVVREKRIPFEIKSEPLRNTASSSKIEYASREAALASSRKMMERFDDAFRELAK